MSELSYHLMEALGWFTMAWMAWAYHRRIEDLEAAVAALKTGDVPGEAQEAWDAEGDNP